MKTYPYDSAHHYSCAFSIDSILAELLCFLYPMTADINECEMETDNCDDNATCTDTIGSFNCTCNHGYDGDGVNCSSEFFFS